eukprot:355849-Chlamydomonas_euryale.AAC.3
MGGAGCGGKQDGGSAASGLSAVAQRHNRPEACTACTALLAEPHRRSARDARRWGVDTRHAAGFATNSVNAI